MPWADNSKLSWRDARLIRTQTAMKIGLRPEAALGYNSAESVSSGEELEP